MTGDQLACGIRDAARVTGLSMQTLRREIREGNLRATRVRKRLLIATADLRNWLAAGANQHGETR
jgi:excisionase family DNA binding protein